MSALVIPEHLPNVLADVACSNVLFPESVLHGTGNSTQYPISIGILNLPRRIEVNEQGLVFPELRPSVFHLDPVSCHGVAEKDTLMYYLYTAGSPSLKFWEVDWLRAADKFNPIETLHDALALVGLFRHRVLVPGYYDFVLPSLGAWYRRYRQLASVKDDNFEQKQKFLEQGLAPYGKELGFEKFQPPVFDFTMLLNAFVTDYDAFWRMLQEVPPGGPPSTLMYYFLQFPETKYRKGYALLTVAQSLFDDAPNTISNLSLADRLRWTARVYLQLLHGEIV